MDVHLVFRRSRPWLLTHTQTMYQEVKHLVMILSQMILKFRYENHALPVINACLLYKPSGESYRWSTTAPARLGTGSTHLQLPPGGSIDRSKVLWQELDGMSLAGNVGKTCHANVGLKNLPGADKRLAPSKTYIALPLRFLIGDRIRGTAFGRFCVSIYRIYIYIIHI